jgi:hypothetical protein
LHSTYNPTSLHSLDASTVISPPSPILLLHLARKSINKFGVLEKRKHFEVSRVLLLPILLSIIDCFIRNSPLNLTAMGRQRKLTANNKPVNCGKLVAFQQQQQDSTHSEQQQQMHFNNQQAFDYRLPNKMTSFYGQEALCDTQSQQQQQQLQQQPLPQEQLEVQQQQQQQEFANITFGCFDSSGTGSQQQQQQQPVSEQQQNLHLDLSFGSCGDNNSSNINNFSGGCSDFLIGHNSCGFGAPVSTSVGIAGHVVTDKFCDTAPLPTKTAPGPNIKGRFSCDPCHVHFSEESQLLSHNR